MEEYQQALKLPYIQTSATRQEVVELSSKVRELEINLMDLKSAYDRRLAQIVEEIPTRLQRELKNIESRDSHLWKENLAKQSQMVESFTQIRDQMRQKQSDLLDKITNFSTMITDTDFRMTSLSKQVEVLSQYQPSGPTSGGMGAYDQKFMNTMEGGNPLNRMERDADVKLLKDMITEERGKRESQLNE